MQNAECPICDGQISVPDGTEESEILTCPECSNRVVVKSITGNEVALDKAPEVEEDWGQ